MPLEPFGPDDLPAAAASLGLPPPDAKTLAACRPLVEGLLGAYGFVESAPDHLPPSSAARHADPRGRRRDRRQGALRVFPPVPRPPYERDRRGPPPAPPGPVGERLVVGLGGDRGDRRGADGDRRRPGGLDPDALVLQRHSSA